MIWKWIRALGLVTLLGLVGCSQARSSVDVAPASEAIIFRPIGEHIPAADTVALEPAVARVNGVSIPMADFEDRVRQFQEAEIQVGLTSDHSSARLAEIEQQVLEGLIDQLIIEQAAQLRQISISEQELTEKVAQMKQGQTEEEFAAWLTLNSFTADEFEQMLLSQLIAARLFSRIIDQAPTSALQVHARHILLSDEAQAQAILADLEAGQSFAVLAQQFSEDEQTRPNGGDLGWFLRETERVPPEVAQTAFELEPGQISAVIESELGYHLVKAELPAANRPLTPQQRQFLQNRMFQNWLAQQRASAQIEQYLN